MGVVDKESDQKHAIPLVERNRGGFKRGPGVEMRRQRRSGAGKHLFDDSRDNLQIILRDAARRSGGRWRGIGIGRRLAAAYSPVTAATGRLGRSHRFRERRDLRQDERQSEQRR